MTYFVSFKFRHTIDLLFSFQTYSTTEKVPS